MRKVKVKQLAHSYSAVITFFLKLGSENRKKNRNPKDFEQVISVRMKLKNELKMRPIVASPIATNRSMEQRSQGCAAIVMAMGR